MNYFNKFPLIAYNYKIKGKDTPLIITNMMVRLRTILANKLDVERLLTDFVISDHESLESISYDLYENVQYHWTIMFVNNRADYIGDFPLNNVTLDKFIDDKYGDQKYAPHHYVDARGKTTGGVWLKDVFHANRYIGNDGQTLMDATPVTNSDYEHQLNDQKRYIKVVHPNYIAQFVTEFEKAMLSV